MTQTHSWCKLMQLHWSHWARSPVGVIWRSSFEVDGDTLMPADDLAPGVGPATERFSHKMEGESVIPNPTAPATPVRFPTLCSVQGKHLSVPTNLNQSGNQAHQHS